MAADTTHECPARGCTRRVPRSKLMCFDHWAMVPAPIQRAVYDAYRRQPGGSDHWTAINDAIETVNEQLEATSNGH